MNDKPLKKKEQIRLLQMALDKLKSIDSTTMLGVDIIILGHAEQHLSRVITAMSNPELYKTLYGSKQDA